MAMSLGLSVMTLPDMALPYPSLLCFLEKRFPHIPLQVWIERILAGKVLKENGDPVTLHSAYLPGSRLFYYREVAEEPKIPFLERIVFQNKHLLVACKPHFLPVTPTGPYVQESLLNRLKKRIGNMSLSPINRIDRETAGLVLFSTNRETRGAYQKMFMQKGRVRKTYSALCCIGAHPEQDEWQIANRLEKGEPWFRMHESPGEVNARTHIRLLTVQGNKAFFELQPITGKKHQLRLHLSNLGFPILNDRYYPNLLEKKEDDFTAPLQLLSRTIAFDDPLTGQPMSFESSRHLSSVKQNTGS